MNILTVTSKPAKAIRFKREEIEDVSVWTNAFGIDELAGHPGVFQILMENSYVNVSDGDYILKDESGTVFTAKPEGFEETFDIVSTTDGLSLDGIEFSTTEGKPVSELIFEDDKIFVELKGVRTEVAEGLYRNGRFELIQVNDASFKHAALFDLDRAADGNGGYAFDGSNGA